MKRLLAIAALLASGCGAQAITRVQVAHGHEFGCDHRYVRVERVDEVRWVSRGCAFEADWSCDGAECELIDARAHGMGAP